MKLYYIPGACSMATHIMLRELDADFELEAVDPVTGKTETGREFKNVNPKGYVPALELETGDVLTEGAAVLSYLADSAVPIIQPNEDGVLSRTRVLEWLTFTSSELHKSFSPLFLMSSSDEQKAQAVQTISAKFDYLETQLADGREFIVGEFFSVADAYLFVVVNWSNFKDISLQQWPNLNQYVARISERPTVVAAMQAEGLGS
ncbi:MAG: glutathione transferase GstA [Kordiimonadaceae bacterium]|nr:glutathione transferase GstA [Kordiimonadaceae bacterium]MBO6569778.1 glutathione transferase GstA [Kordiimonadaceae bacterium]MBO6966313.1 glutathione transferase GstA [Kordiimonadaceae bacterium]